MTAKATWGAVLLAGSVVAMTGIAALPYALRGEQLDTLAEKRLELRFMEARLKTTQNGPKNRLTEADNIDPVFVNGQTPGLAVAEMQSFASKLAGESGMAVQRLQPLQADRNGNLAVLRIEAEVTGSIEGLRRYLLAIESGVPMVFVNRLRIAAPEAASDEGVLPSDQLTATLQLESFGWWEATP
jgi:hypothetical protein